MWCSISNESRREREAQATAALSSPHTIQVFDFGITQDPKYYDYAEPADGPVVTRFAKLAAEREEVLGMLSSMSLSRRL